MNRKKVSAGIYLLYPLLLSVIFTFLMTIHDLSGLIIYSFLAVCYLLPIYGFNYFIKKRPFNQWLLFIGFVFVPLFPFLYEYIHGGWFQYLGTVLVAYFYAIPYIVIALIIALIITIKERRRVD